MLVLLQVGTDREGTGLEKTRQLRRTILEGRVRKILQNLENVEGRTYLPDIV